MRKRQNLIGGNMDIYELIDYYIDKYLEEKDHQTDGYTRVGMLQGLLWICRFGGVTDEDLGEDRLIKILFD